MSEIIKNPAFPHEYKYGDGTAHRDCGMSLRDYFAAKALPAVIAALVTRAEINVSELSTAEIAGKIAFDYADAMLDERK